MRPSRLRARLRNYANKCRMLSELTRTPADDSAKAAAARGMLVVVSSPSGGGKGTLIQRVLSSLSNLAYSVSYTTRASRPGELNGREYFFVSTVEFEELIARGTDSPEDLQRRLTGAPAEVEQYKEFEYVILNDDVECAANKLAAIITAER